MDQIQQHVESVYGAGTVVGILSGNMNQITLNFNISANGGDAIETIVRQIAHLFRTTKTQP